MNWKVEQGKTAADSWAESSLMLCRGQEVEQRQEGLLAGSGPVSGRSVGFFKKDQN